MSDIGSALQPFTVGAIAPDPVRFLGLAPAASSGQLGVGSSVPLPRNGLGRRIAEWAIGGFVLVRAKTRVTGRRRESDRRYCHPRREAFLEDAAMSREMDRL
jgi:hypothetical protein